MVLSWVSIGQATILSITQIKQLPVASINWEQLRDEY